MEKMEQWRQTEVIQSIHFTVRSIHQWINKATTHYPQKSHFAKNVPFDQAACTTHGTDGLAD